MISLKVEQILTTRELVGVFGTEKQKDSYLRTGKLMANTKNSILKEASCYCKLEAFKEGREVKYRVIEVYESKQGIESDGYVEKSPTLLLVQALLLNKLVNENGTVFATNNTIAEDIKMVNSNYKNIADCNRSIIEPYEHRYLATECKTEVRNVIESALKSMKKRYMLYYNENIFVKIEEIIEVVTDGMGNVIHIFEEPQISKCTRVANTKEKKAITKARREACLALKCVNFNEVYFKNKAGIFHKIVEVKLKDWGFGYIKGYFEGYEINADEVQAKYDLEETIRELKEKELNDVVANKLLNRMNDKFEKNGVGFGENNKLRHIPSPATSKKFIDTYIRN